MYSPSALLSLILLLCIASLNVLAMEDKLEFAPFTPDHDTVAAYWTKERMAAAIPMDLIVKEFNASEFNQRISPNGKPIIVEGYTPKEFMSTVKDTNIASPLYPFPFTEGFAPNYNTNPWNMVGKIFFSMGGGNYVCSGAVGGRYIIYTAGHCVYSLASGWYTNLIFIPGYNNGGSLYPTFSAYSAVIATSWYNSETICDDIAVVVLNKVNNYGVGEHMGWFGSLWGGSTALSWRSLGYPAGPPFNGQLNYWSDSALGTIDNAQLCDPKPLGIGSRATGGASGGPWVYEFGSNNYINSVNSYKWSNQPDAIYGPYFGTLAYNIYTGGSGITPP